MGDNIQVHTLIFPDETVVVATAHPLLYLNIRLITGRALEIIRKYR